jgi:hypothetical protein
VDPNIAGRAEARYYEEYSTRACTLAMDTGGNGSSPWSHSTA